MHAEHLKQLKTGKIIADIEKVRKRQIWAVMQAKFRVRQRKKINLNTTPPKRSHIDMNFVSDEPILKKRAKSMSDLNKNQKIECKIVNESSSKNAEFDMQSRFLKYEFSDLPQYKNYPEKKPRLAVFCDFLDQDFLPKNLHLGSVLTSLRLPFDILRGIIGIRDFRF